MSDLEKLTATCAVVGSILVLVGCMGMWVFGAGLLFLVGATVWVVGASAIFASVVGCLFAALAYIWRK